MENTETLNSICFITRGNIVSSVTNIEAKYTFIYVRTKIGRKFRKKDISCLKILYENEENIFTIF